MSTITEWIDESLTNLSIVKEASNINHEQYEKLTDIGFMLEKIKRGVIGIEANSMPEDLVDALDEDIGLEHRVRGLIQMLGGLNSAQRIALLKIGSAIDDLLEYGNEN